LIQDAITAAAAYVNFATYDTNADGRITGDELAVIVFAAGYENAYGGSAAPTPNVWGHANWGQNFTIPGSTKKIDGYTLMGEIHGNGTANHQATLGIVVHELGHLMLQWPDLYDIDGSSQGIGAWCLMSSGSWGYATGQDQGATPVMPSAYLRNKNGWVTPITASGSVSLTASGAGLATATASNTVVKMATNGATTEYFLMENRQAQGYDQGFQGLITGFGGGLAIWHIDDSISCASNSCNANDSHRMVNLEAADGWTGASSRGAKTNLWYSGNGVSFNSTSTPNSNLYSGSSSGVSVSGVSASGTVMTATTVAGAGGGTTYTVTATPGTGGSVTPASQSVASGTTTTFTVTPNTGYMADTPPGGTCAAGFLSGTTYTTGAITANCTVSFTFTAVTGPTTGSDLTVTLLPAEAITAGAQWSVDGGTTWNDSGATVENLAAGPLKVFFKPATGYNSPATKTVTISLKQTTTATGTYTLATSGTGSLKVNISPKVSSTFLGGQWSIDDGATWNDTGTTVPSLTAGSYVVTFSAVDSYTAPDDKVVTVRNATTPTTTTGVYKSGYMVTAKASVGGSVTPKVKSAIPLSTPILTLRGNPGFTQAQGSGTCGVGSYGTWVIGKSFTYTLPSVTSACTKTFDFSGAPAVTTGAAKTITQTGATIGSLVNPRNDLTTVSFDYVPDPGTTAPSAYTSSVSAGVFAGGLPQTVSAAVTGLTCGTKYHFRAVATNSIDPFTTRGSDRSFTTTKCADSPADSNVAKSAVSDFDGDGKSDILFRDAVSGQTAEWMMNGANVTSSALTSMNAGAYTSTSGWQAQGIGDFDGDKKYDLLWRDSATGELAVWTMNGATVVTSATTSVNPGAYTSTAGWQVQGIGDFDGDGKSDILWRDTATGQTAIWFMNGAVVSSSSNTNVSAGAYTSTTGWQVHGVGDFDGDGKADILWRHAGTGKTVAWLMNGATKTGGGYTNVQAGAYTSTTGWQVQGAGDFNGDGKSDILLRSAETGRMAIWTMNGVKVVSSAYTSVDAGAYTSSAGLQVSAIADYNGDGKYDILLRDAVTGQTRVWVMNGSQVTSDTATDVNPGAYTPSTGWSVVSEEAVR
jgi:M6 family metalloprotease-like protein